MNSRDKGKRGELEWVHFCKDQGYEARRSAQYCGKTGDAADVVGLPGIHFEVKRVESLNINKAMEQAIRDAKEGIPVVAHRRDRDYWKITMRAEDFFDLYRRAHDNGGDKA